MTASFTMKEMVPGIYQVHVPMPGNPLHNLNSYFVLGPEKTTVIDVGLNHPDCEAALDQALHELGRSWDTVEIVLTHSHPDHTGNLDRIWRPWMRIYANMHSFQEVKNLLDMQSTVYNPLLHHLVNPEVWDKDVQARDASVYQISNELLPLRNEPQLLYLEDGDIYRNGDFYFRVIATPGHDDWHICLYEPTRKVLISGDHVLERITPTIMSWMPAYNALAEFMNSLDKVRDLDVDLILPGHGDAFAGVAERVDYVKAHHRARLEELYQLVLDGHTSVIDIARSAKWRHPDWDSWSLDQKFYSMGETLAHLVYLVNKGDLIMTCTNNKRRFYVESQWDVRARK